MTTTAEALVSPAQLQLMHATPQRLRLHYSETMAAEALAGFHSALGDQTWVRSVQQREDIFILVF